MNIFVEETERSAEFATRDLIPQKSRKIYTGCYDRFIDWSMKKNISEYSEDVLLEYFCEESKKVKCSTLWSHYSMLKQMLIRNKNVDISRFLKLTAFLKNKMGGYKPKKSKSFTRQELDSFFSEAPDNQFLLMKVVALMGIVGACRREELVKMRTNDIQDIGTAIIVNIPDIRIGMERSFTIMDNGNISYLEKIRKYINLRPPCDHNRFFIKYVRGKCTNQPVGVNKIGKIPSEIATYLNLTDAAAYTGHSFRRTSAMLLVNRGEVQERRAESEEDDISEVAACEEEKPCRSEMVFSRDDAFQFIKVEDASMVSRFKTELQEETVRGDDPLSCIKQEQECAMVGAEDVWRKVVEGEYCLMRKAGVWEKFSEVLHASTRSCTGYMMCDVCQLVLHSGGLGEHVCHKEATVSDAARAAVLDNFVMVCAEDLLPCNIVDNEGFRELAQTLVNIGAAYGEVSIADILPSARTLRRKVNLKENENQASVVYSTS